VPLPRGTAEMGGGPPAADEAALRAAVASNPGWYHTIALAPGVTTPGHVDLRHLPAAVLPPSLAGRRALDVGTFDGFWAFELERRGAAEVVAIDVPALDAAEWPPVNRDRLEATMRALDLELGRGFRIAAAALGSAARRVEVAVYDLDADAVGGPVDFAFLGAMLLHVRDPVRALERIRAVLAPGGRLTLLEPVDPVLSLLAPRRPAARLQVLETDFNWWVANVACLQAWLRAAGFASVARGGLHRADGMTQCALAAWG
jgi:tRNA (mo5U34)-methyltransferase